MFFSLFYLPTWDSDLLSDTKRIKIYMEPGYCLKNHPKYVIVFVFLSKLSSHKQLTQWPLSLPCFYLHIHDANIMISWSATILRCGCGI